ncbi:MAG: hypothetical protein R2878_10600 [Thermoleophilia bacterium]
MTRTADAAMIEPLATGAEIRVTGPLDGSPVLCLNGGTSTDRPGTWGASIRWIVRELAPEFPDRCFAEVRYRNRSWRRIESGVADAAAAAAVLADRTGRAPQVLGYSMGGAVGLILACRTPDIARFVGLAPWIPDQLDLAPLDGRRIDVIHGSLDGWLPLIPGVSVASSRRGVARAREAGADAHHTVIRGAIHAVAFDGPGDLLIPAPRAGRWRDLARNALAQQSDALRPHATPPGADARDAHRWAP